MQHEDESSAPNRLVEEDRIGEVSNRGRVFRFKTPLLFTPHFDAALGLYIFDNYPLGISIHSEEIDDLREELADQVRFLWDAYALEEDEALTPAALELKRRLLIDIEEVGGAEA